MKVSRSKSIKILSEISFLLALSIPMLKVHLIQVFNNIDIIYGVLYILIISGSKYFFTTNKNYFEYLAGLFIFMLFALNSIISGLHLSPSILLMVIICFGKPFWHYHRTSIFTYFFAVLLLLTISFAAKDNVILVLSQVLLSGQNYLSALIFSIIYLLFFVIRGHNHIRGIIYLGFGSMVLFLLRSRTSIVALVPIFIIYFKKINILFKILVILFFAVFIIYGNLLESLFYKYNEGNLLAGFNATRGDVWRNTLEYLVSNLWSPLYYATADTEVRRLLVGASSSHNWLLENFLIFGILAIIPVYLTGMALIRNFAIFLPLLIFALFEPSVFYVANIISFLFLSYLITQRKVIKE